MEICIGLYWQSQELGVHMNNFIEQSAATGAEFLDKKSLNYIKKPSILDTSSTGMAFRGINPALTRLSKPLV